MISKYLIGLVGLGTVAGTGVGIYYVINSKKENLGQTETIKDETEYSETDGIFGSIKAPFV